MSGQHETTLEVPFRRRLLVRLTTYLTLALVVTGVGIVAVDGMLVRSRELAQLERRADAQAESLTELLSSTMVQDGQQHFGAALNFVAQQTEIDAAHVVDLHGKTIFSSQLDLIGTELDIGAADLTECIQAPGGSGPTGVLMDDTAGRRFRQCIRVDNRLECSRCHGVESATLGALVLDLSTRRMDTELRDHPKLSAAIVTITLVVALGAIIVLISGLVRRPLTALLNATAQVEAGNLQVRLRPQANDEIARLGSAFDRMIERLEDHTRDLETAVEVRTSEIRALDRSLREAQAQLLRTNRLATMGEMAAAVAHEVRTPLNALALHLHLLRRWIARRGPDAAEEVDRIADEIRRIDGVINRFLAMAKFPPPSVTRVDLNRVADTVLAVMEPEAQRSGVHLVKRYTAPAPALLYDEDRLRHVLFNLVLNAIQALDEGGTVILRTCSDPIRIEVEDDGPGVPPDLRNQIFKPFYTTKDTGTGLGLAIAHRMLREIGSALRYEDRGRGAVFALDLRAMDSDEETPS